MENSKAKLYLTPVIIEPGSNPVAGVKPQDIIKLRIGSTTYRASLVPASREVYLNIMRPLWALEKRKQRNSFCLSLDQAYEDYEFDPADQHDDFLAADLFMLLEGLISRLEELSPEDARFLQAMYEVCKDGKDPSLRRIAEKLGCGKSSVGERLPKLVAKSKKIIGDNPLGD